MAFGALSFLGVEENLASTNGIAGTRQGRGGKPFPLWNGALAPEAELKLRSFSRLIQPDQDAIGTFREAGLRAVGTCTIDAGLLALEDDLPVEPNRLQPRAGG